MTSFFPVFIGQSYDYEPLALVMTNDPITSDPYDQAEEPYTWRVWLEVIIFLFNQ